MGKTIKKAVRFANSIIAGFTMVELLVAITVIGILSTIGVVSYIGVQEKGRDSQRQDKVVIIAEAFEKYYDANGSYPTCADLYDSAKIKDLFSDVDSTVFTAPKADDGTISLVCDNGTVNDPTAVSDTFKYTITNPTTGAWEIKYYSEQSKIVEIGAKNRRNLSTIPVASLTHLEKPNLGLRLVGITDDVNISWGKIDNASGYALKYQKVGDATWTDINTSSGVENAGVFSLQKSGLSTNTDYIFSIVAKGDGVNFSDSAENTGNIKFFNVGLTNNAGGASLTGAGYYKTGENIAVAATPKTNFVFDKWNGDCTATSDNFSINAIDKNYACSASYAIPAPTAPTVTASTVGSTTTWSWNSTCPSGTSTTYQYDYLIENIASGFEIYHSGWQPSAGRTSNTYPGTTSSEGYRYTISAHTSCQQDGITSSYSNKGELAYIRPIINYTLSTSITPVGGGTISGNTAGQYQSGTTISLTATAANSGFSFAGWTGCSTSTSSTISMIMSSDKNCIANFAINAPTAPTVTASTAGNTTTWSWNNTCPAGTSARYQYDYLINNIAAGIEIYHSGWVTSTSNTHPGTTSSEGYKYTLSARTQCYIGSTNSSYSASNYAEYIRPIVNYDLVTAINLSGAGSIYGSGNGSAVGIGTYSFVNSTSFNITASNYSGYTFSGWSGCSTSTSSTISIVMNSNKYCTANYTINTPSAPTAAATSTADTVTGVFNATCPTGTTVEYAISRNTNDGSWSSGSWSSTYYVSISNAQGAKYGFSAVARCKHTSGAVSGISGSSSAYAGYIAKPSSFSVGASYTTNAYITTALGIYMWAPTSCPSGTSVSYDYYYLRNSTTPLTKESAGNYYTDYSLYDTGEGYSLPYTTAYIAQGLTTEIRLRSKCSNAYYSSEWSDEMSTSILSPVLVPSVALSIGRTAASDVATMNGYTSKKNDIWTQAAITCGLGTNIYSRADIYSSKYKFTGASSYGWYSASNGGSWLINNYYDIGTFNGIYRLTLVTGTGVTVPAGSGSGTFGIRVRPKCKNNHTGVEGFTPDASNSSVPALQQDITLIAPALL